MGNVKLRRTFYINGYLYPANEITPIQPGHAPEIFPKDAEFFTEVPKPEPIKPVATTLSQMAKAAPTGPVDEED